MQSGELSLQIALEIKYWSLKVPVVCDSITGLFNQSFHAFDIKCVFHPVKKHCA